MYIIKNKTKQKVLGNNYGNMAGRDIYEIYSDQRKNISITQNFYNAPSDDNSKKYYTEEYKNYVNSFKELEGYLFGFVFPMLSKKYDFSSDYLKFGKVLLDWIMGISNFPLKEYKKFCKELISIYKIDKDDVILKRWEAFGKYFSSDIFSSVSIYNNILNEIEHVKCPYDLFDDILIDGRNILIESEQLNNKIIVHNPFQEEIDRHGRKLAMPIYDRIKADIYEKVLKDTFKVETKKPNDIIYGSGLNSILNDIQNLVYNAIFYGSITHMKLCREVIANVMYSYSKIYEDEGFYKITLKMLALSGEYVEYKNLCLYLGDSLNFWYDSIFISDISSLVNRTLDYHKINYQNFIYGFYGKYLNDEEYLKLEENIFKYLIDTDNINISLAYDIFKNIRLNLYRTRKLTKLMDIFEIFISKNYARFYDELANILNNIDINQIDSKQYKKYVTMVYELSKKYNYTNLKMSIAKILNKGSYTMKFSKYKKDPRILELMTFEEEISDNYVFLEKMINDYKKRYEEKEKNPEVVVSYDVSYTLSREYYIEVSTNKNIINLISKKYLPLVLNILISENQTNSFKLEQLKNILYISSIKDYNFLKEKILSIIEKMKYGNGKEREYINCFNYEEVNNFEIDLYKETIKSLLNDGMSLNDIIIMCFENNFNKKLSFSSISNCLKIIGISNVENEYILNSIYCFYMSVPQNNYSSKLQMLEILCIFHNTKIEAKALKIMKNLSVDCSFETAKKIISVIRYYDSKKTTQILANLEKNGNFNVRSMVEDYRNKNIKK